MTHFWQQGGRWPHRIKPWCCNYMPSFKAKETEKTLSSNAVIRKASHEICMAGSNTWMCDASQIHSAPLHSCNSIEECFSHQSLAYREWSVVPEDVPMKRRCPLLRRVSRGVGGWFNRPKKCFTPSKIQNSKKWSKVCSRVLWNIVTLAGSWSEVIWGLWSSETVSFLFLTSYFRVCKNPNFFMLWDNAIPRPLFPTAMGVLVWRSGLGFALTQSIKKLGFLHRQK